MIVQIIERDPEGALYLEAISERGRMEVVTAVRVEGATAYLDGFHVDGLGAGSVGVAALRAFARELGHQLGVQRLVIRGGLRTTGANPGRLPRPIVIPVEGS